MVGYHFRRHYRHFHYSDHCDRAAAVADCDFGLLVLMLSGLVLIAICMGKCTYIHTYMPFKKFTFLLM